MDASETILVSMWANIASQFAEVLKGTLELQRYELENQREARKLEHEFQIAKLKMVQELAKSGETKVGLTLNINV